MSKPVLAVGLLATMVGAWYWAMQPSARPVVSHRAASPLPLARPARQVPAVRLSDLGAGAASRPTPDDRRNPFASAGPGSAAGSARPVAAAAVTSAPLVSAGPAAPPWPRLELIGVAEALDRGALVRTAIMSGPHGVHHARAGELLEQVYRVERIGADGVDVRLLPEDRVLRLALRP